MRAEDCGTMCERDLGFGRRCTGDLTKPGTHAVECGLYIRMDLMAEIIPDPPNVKGKK